MPTKNDRRMSPSSGLLADLSELDWVGFLRWLLKQPFRIVAGALLGVLLAVVAILVLPPSYRASTLIFVEPPRVPTDFVRQTVSGNIQDRLDTIHQQVTNRANLESIVRELRLYPDLMAENEIELAVRRASDSLGIEVHGNQVFRVSFEARDPEVAANTANRVAEVFIETNLSLREELAASTTSFLELELADTKAKLEEQEEAIAGFKRKNLGALPEQQEALLGAVDSAESRLNTTMRSIDETESRRISLRREISDLRRGLVNGSVGVPRENVVVGPREPSRLELARRELHALLAQYTEKHPDVIRLRSEIESLSAMATDSAGEVDDESGLRPLEFTADERTYLTGLERELSTLEFEIENLNREKERLNADITRDRASLRGIPNVETQLLSLTRDYDNLSQSYNSLLQKKLDAGLAENLEKRQQGEQFRILDRAVPPARPFSPPKLLLLLAGIAAGAMGGLGLSLLRFRTHSTFPDAGSLIAFAPGVEFLGSIPELDLEEGGAVERTVPIAVVQPARRKIGGSAHG